MATDKNSKYNNRYDQSEFIIFYMIMQIQFFQKSFQ